MSDPALAGVHVIDLLPRLQEAGWTSTTFNRYAMDGVPHLTPEGHRLVARIIEDLLREPSWVEARRSGRSSGSPLR